MKKNSIWLPVIVSALAAGVLTTGCGKKKNAVPDEVISLKQAKARGPVRPNPQIRAKMKAATKGQNR